MARYYVHPCDLCHEPTTQRLLGRDTENMQILECDKCGSKHMKVPAVVPKKKTTWPYYNGSVGVTFESESHEMKYAKANNLEKI